jgi:hypothetical protein
MDRQRRKKEKEKEKEKERKARTAALRNAQITQRTDWVINFSIGRKSRGGRLPNKPVCAGYYAGEWKCISICLDVAGLSNVRSCKNR